MSRVLLAWELGGGLGHVGTFRPLARKLKSLGHEVHVALRDVTWARAFLGNEGFPCYQAPVWARKVVRPGEAPLRSYADIIATVGWTDPAALAGTVQAWRSLYQLVRPDVLIANHAPTALLAATGMGIRTVRLGTGFGCPPLTTPLPSMRDWAPTPAEQLLETEELILESVRRVLKDFKLPDSVGSLAEVLRTDDEILCTFPELDHYVGRKDGKYFGPLFADDEGVEPRWPEGKGGRIFAYLRPGYAELSTTLDALRESGRPTFAAIPGLRPDLANKNASVSLQISTQPARIVSAASQCELAVCHGGHGTVAAMLLAGVPLVLLPEHMEQFLLSRRVEAVGAGETVGLSRDENRTKRALETSVQGKHRAGALAFRKVHADFSGAEKLEKIAVAFADSSDQVPTAIPLAAIS